MCLAEYSLVRNPPSSYFFYVPFRGLIESVKPAARFEVVG